MSSFPCRFQWDKPGRDGRLWVGFASNPPNKLRSALAANPPNPLVDHVWFSPLVVFYTHEHRSTPNGRFDHGISGAAGAAPTTPQIEQYRARVLDWLETLHAQRAIGVVWANSGAYRKPMADPEFVLAWADLVARLPMKYDGFIDRIPTEMLRRWVKELPKPQRSGVDEVIEGRKRGPFYM